MMTVREIGHGSHRYMWDTADTKPTAATHGCATGDTGYDRQTGIMYITYDGTNWVEKNTVARNVTAVGHGVETVDAAGTHQKISTTSVAAKWVIIQAQTDNTSAIAVGITGVDATVATGTGLLLYAGDWSPMLPITNLQDIWIDALVQDEGVRFIYFT